MLTARQLERRRRSVGASDVPAIVGESPWRDSLDVWGSKCSGPDLATGPAVIEPPPDPDTCAAFAPLVATDPRTAGQILERGLVQLYCHRTGRRVRRAGLRVHERHRHHSACPDAVVLGGKIEGDRGLECKLISSHMAHDWEAGTVPPYVQTQCQWSMHVTGLPRWDVAALIDGTTFEIYRVERDDELIEALVLLVDRFWVKHVLTGVMPEPTYGSSLRRIVEARFPEDDDLSVDAPAVAEPIVRELYEAQRLFTATNERIDILKAKLAEMCGERRSIRDSFWGRFEYATRPGQVRYKDIAEHAYDGPVPDHVKDVFRGEAVRSAQLFPSRAFKEEMESQREVA